MSNDEIQEIRNNLKTMSEDELNAWIEANPVLSKGLIYSRETGLDFAEVLELPNDVVEEFVQALYVVCLHKMRVNELIASHSDTVLASELVM